MGLAKEGYSDAVQSKTRVKVNTNADGNIATGSDVVYGTKNFTINQANATNSLADNTKVLEFFIGLVGGTQNSNTNVASVTWTV